MNRLKISYEKLLRSSMQAVRRLIQRSRRSQQPSIQRLRTHEATEHGRAEIEAFW